MPLETQPVHYFSPFRSVRSKSLTFDIVTLVLGS
jgi:hypothetical protein